VEVDETYIGRQEGMGVDKSGFHNKNMVVTLVERGGSPVGAIELSGSYGRGVGADHRQDQPFGTPL